MGFIQLQAATEKPIGTIIGSVRVIMSKACGGIDDMHLLGNKALVVRAEIFLPKLESLCAELNAVQVEVNPHSLPKSDSLKIDEEHLITLQVTSFTRDTDGYVDVPKVPG